MQLTMLVPSLWLAGAALSAQEWVKDVECVATSRQVPGYIDEKLLVSDEGLLESPPGSGIWLVERKARGWNSNYGVLGGRNDESPVVEFRFAEAQDISGMLVWNASGGRGFQTVTVQYAAADKEWAFLPNVFTLQPGPEAGDFTSEHLAFGRVLNATRIRLWCHATHRGRYGQPDVAGLVRVRFLKASTDAPAASEPHTSQFPDDAGLVNVQSAPYFARGDGQTDDTQAIQQAMWDCQATRRAVYLPAGKYLVSATLAFRPGYFHGDNNLRGDGPDRTVIQLQEDVFTDPDDPQAVITFGFHGQPGGPVSADWFNNNIRDLTIDVGRNSGAIGLQFYSNNAGAVRNLVLRAPGGAGVTGLDLGYQDQNGPLLVQDVTIEGFDTGVSAGNSVNSQTLCDLRLLDQRSAAVRNRGQCLTIAGLHAEGGAPRITSEWGFLTILDSELHCRPAMDGAAIESGEYVCAVNLRTSGFGNALASNSPQRVEIPDPHVEQYFNAPRFGSSVDVEHVRLERRRTKNAAPVADERWVNVRNFRRIDEVDDAAAFQRAIDSGAEVVYASSIGTLAIGSTVVIRGNLRRLIGFQSQLQVLDAARPAFRIEPSHRSQLEIQGWIDMGQVENQGEGVLLLQDIQGIDARLRGRGDVFLENTVGEIEIGTGQRVWARQLNAEREGTKILNQSGELVLIGLKTERGGTLVETTSGGRTEVFGGLCYTTTRGDLAPMFVNRDASLWAVIGEVCYTGDPLQVLVREERDGMIREWRRDEVPRRFDFLQGSAVFYDGH